MPIIVENPRQLCRHIFTDGHRCGSPCLRQESFCFYHHTQRRPATKQANPQPGLDLLNPEDRSAIQAGNGQVLRALADYQLDPKRAALLLYGLQIASHNLAKPLKGPVERDRMTGAPISPATVDEIVVDGELGILAPACELPADRPRPTLEELQMAQYQAELAAGLYDDDDEEEEEEDRLELEAAAGEPAAREVPREQA